MAETADNKRRWKRFNVDLRIRIVFMKSGTRQVAFGRGNDVSEGGLAVFVPLEIEIGTQVEVEFSTPRLRTPLLLPATVRHRHGNRYGIEFLTLSPAQRHDIVRLCETATLSPST